MLDPLRALRRRSAGGDDGTRTHDLLVANQALYQLSYVPGRSGLPALERIERMVGLGGFEPPTLRLSGVRSNQLSYRPSGLRTCTATGAAPAERRWVASEERVPVIPRR